MCESLAVVLMALLIAAGCGQHNLDGVALGSSISPDEDSARYRQMILEANKKIVEQHNRNKSHTYTLAINGLAYLSQEQITRLYLALIPSQPVTIKYANQLINSVQSSGQQTATVEETAPSSQPEQPTVKLLSSPIRIATTQDQAQYTRTASLNTQQELILPQETAPKLNYAKMLGMSRLKQKAPTQPDTSQQQTNDNQLNAKPSPMLTKIDLIQSVFGIAREFLEKRHLPENQIDHLLQERKNTIPLDVTSQANFEKPPRLLQSAIPVDSLSEYNVDWSCVTGRAMNQGRCGACYAFAAADSVSALMAIYHYTFYIKLAVQQIVECARNGMVFGCTGGFLEGSFAYMATTGIFTDFNYPYTLSEQFSEGACKKASINPKSMQIFIKDFSTIQSKSCDDLRIRLSVQPLAVGMAGRLLVLYHSGIFNGCTPQNEIDHAVVLVGYQQGKGWKIKNSWGTEWGENGYGWLADGNTCKICEMAFYPILEESRGYANMIADRKLIKCPQN